MKKYEYVTGINGSKKPYILRMKLSENIDVEKGQIIYYGSNKQIITPTPGTTTVIAGICAKTYKAAPSDLCPDYGTGMIDVIVSPDAVYKTDPWIVTDSGSSFGNGILTNVEDFEHKWVNSILGSKLVLIEKGEGSTNKLAIGEEVEIKSIEVENNYITFITSKEINGSANDKYVFVPNFGFDLFSMINDSWIIDFENRGQLTILEANPECYYMRFRDIYLGLI